MTILTQYQYHTCSVYMITQCSHANNIIEYKLIINSSLMEYHCRGIDPQKRQQLLTPSQHIPVFLQWMQPQQPFLCVHVILTRIATTLQAPTKYRKRWPEANSYQNGRLQLGQLGSAFPSYDSVTVEGDPAGFFRKRQTSKLAIKFGSFYVSLVVLR